MGSKVRNKTKWVLLQNLPWNVSNKDIESLFANIETPHIIHIFVDSQGYPNWYESNSCGWNVTFVFTEYSDAAVKFSSHFVASQVIDTLNGKCKIGAKEIALCWVDRRRYSLFEESQFKNDYTPLSVDVNESTFNQVRSKLLRNFRQKRKTFNANTNSKDKLIQITHMTSNKDVTAQMDKSLKKLHFDRQKENHNLFWGEKKKKQLEKAKRLMVDTRMLTMLQRGKTLEQARPKTPGEIKATTREKPRIWHELGISKGKFDKLKETENWQTGKSVISHMIAKKKTIKIKDYWKDTPKFNRKRQNTKFYIRKDRGKPSSSSDTKKKFRLQRGVFANKKPQKSH
ncbi:hypothetical protein RFI_27145 [Reticulomyxa filosa]|uniref:RRM domain-containing protein n=1 Tax=Reticulomyxa filosa TaxID=46433 RepID=X6M9R9_RETFI|nr:hypothetical protein RFI_27145 [Reticulomyxa filosa]|eukprot:ETO10227.1 hypothetical protein RFI_27145 [Reticulomyxa filosa]